MNLPRKKKSIPLPFPYHLSVEVPNQQVSIQIPAQEAQHVLLDPFYLSLFALF